MNKFFAQRKDGLSDPEKLPYTTTNLQFKVWAVPNDEEYYIGKVYVVDGGMRELVTYEGFTMSNVAEMCGNYIKRCYEIKENKIPESVQQTDGYYIFEVDEEPYTDKKYYGSVYYVKPSKDNPNLVYRTVLYHCKTEDYEQTKFLCERALQYFKDTGITDIEVNKD